MTMPDPTQNTSWTPTAVLSGRSDLVWLGAATVMALIGLSLGYGFHFEFVCRDVFAAGFCQTLSLAVPRVLCSLGLVALVLALRPALFGVLARCLRPVCDLTGLIAAGVGLAMIFAPLAALLSLGQVPMPGMLLVLWLGGLAALAGGLAVALLNGAALVEDSRWRSLMPVIAAGTVGLALPDVVLSLQPLWRVEAISNITFDGVLWLLALLGEDVASDKGMKALSYDNFGVFVGPQCSGVEGFALLTVFTTAFLLISRKQLRMGRAWILLPVAILLSWLFNMVRITVLMLIGRYISVELAIGGFHSHAGWIVFLTLALAIAWSAHRIRWFHKDPAMVAAASKSEVPPFFDDPAVGLILPFAVFMLSATVTSALSETPAILHPWRAAAVVLALWLTRRVWLALMWRLDGLSLAAGAACGGLWLLTAPAAGAEDLALITRLEALSGLGLTLWIATRLIGTVVLVPMLEESFFRGYLQDRIAGIGGRFAMAWPWIGLVLSAALFGALHDRFIAGALAGVFFGLIYRRRGALADAIQSHAAANAVIAAAAVLGGGWHLI